MLSPRPPQPPIDPAPTQTPAQGDKPHFASIRDWLASIELPQYGEAFDTHAISWALLPELNHDLLKEIGVQAVGHRIAMLKAINEVSGNNNKTAPPPRRDDASQYAPPSGGIRRQLTIMYCDIVQSSALVDDLDPEDAGRILRHYLLNEWTPVIEKFGGFVARYQGDGVMAYFGYPLARESSGESAVRAGLAIISAMNELGTRADNSERFRVRVRIGIATGPVVVGDVIGKGSSQEISVTGEAAHIAERLQDTAQPNSVVIDALTRKLALEHFEYEDLGQKLLKGFSAPKRTWRVVGDRSTEGRFEARHPAGITPLAGRTAEFALMARMWEQAREGAGQVLLLSGEAGIGKSRLTQSLREHISNTNERHTVLRFHCSPYHRNSTLYPIVEHIRRAAGFDAADDTATKIAKIEAVLQHSFKEISPVAPLYTEMLSIDTQHHYPSVQRTPQALKEATLTALANHLAATAASNPVLLVLEDAQWIDPTTNEAFDIILRNCAQQSILAVITFRLDPEYQCSWYTLEHASTLRLGRLMRHDAEQMLTGISLGKTISSDTVNYILSKAEGVPLFVEEFTRTVLEGENAPVPGDADALNAWDPKQAIPATLQDSLMARLDRATAAREAAQVAACIGRQFSVELLADVLDLEKTTLEKALAQLEQAGLLLRSTTAVNEDSYRFKHALIQDAAYDSMLKSRRKYFHSRIADKLRADVDVMASTPETLAHHYMQAERYADAATFWSMAAERYGAYYANVEAIKHSENGLAALAHLPRSDELARMELKLRIGLSDAQRILNLSDEALKQLDIAEAIATEYQSYSQLSRIHHSRGNLYYPLGNIVQCHTEHRAAWDFAQNSGSIEDQARAQGGLGDAHFLAGRIRLAHEHFENCVTLAREHGLRLTEVAYLPMRAVTHMYSLRFTASLEDCRSVIELTEQMGQARGELIARNTCSWILLDQHAYAQAKEHAQMGLEAVKRIGARSFLPLFNDVLARFRFLEGDRSGALQLLDESWNVSNELGTAFVGPVVLGAVALVTADRERRLDALRQGEKILAGNCASHNYFRFYRDAIEVSLREGAWDEAERYADDLQKYCGTDPSEWPARCMARGRALALAGRQGASLSVIELLDARPNPEAANDS